MIIHIHSSYSVDCISHCLPADKI